MPPSPVVREAARRAREAIHELVRSGAVSRRDLLRSAAASAAVLSALAACSAEEGSSRGTAAPGGTFQVPSSQSTSASSTVTTIDPAAASAVLDDHEPVMDVQLHFLDHDADVAIAKHVAEQAAHDLAAIVLTLAHAAARNIHIVTDVRDQAEACLVAQNQIRGGADFFGL